VSRSVRHKNLRDADDELSQIDDNENRNQAARARNKQFEAQLRTAQQRCVDSDERPFCSHRSAAAAWPRGTALDPVMGW
jgi:hypothetical protein